MVFPNLAGEELVHSSRVLVAASRHFSTSESRSPVEAAVVDLAPGIEHHSSNVSSIIAPYALLGYPNSICCPCWSPFHSRVPHLSRTLRKVGSTTPSLQGIRGAHDNLESRGFVVGLVIYMRLSRREAPLFHGAACGGSFLGFAA